MTTNPLVRRVLSALTLCTLALAPTVASASPDPERLPDLPIPGAEALPTIPIPAGYTHWCSVRNGTAWGFSWGTNACEANGWTGSIIKGAGYYSINGLNWVTARCGASQNNNIIFHGVGETPLSQAYNEAYANGGGSCEFKVSPDNLPIFGPPVSIDPLPKGFSFAQYVPDFVGFPPGNDEALDPLDFGRTRKGSGNSKVIDYKGFDHRADGLVTNNHMAFDIGMPVGTPLLALAKGFVWAVRKRDIPAGAAASCPTDQNELYILYTVGSGKYAEQFLAYYAHFRDDWKVKVGDTVQQGQIVAYSASTGCSGGPHLHYNIHRVTNTARAYRNSINTSTGIYGIWYGVAGAYPDNQVAPIDPFGWKAPEGADPQSWRYYFTVLNDRGPGTNDRIGAGAQSINLWKSGQAHPRPCDGNSKSWRRRTSSGAIELVKNPFRTCS